LPARRSPPSVDRAIRPGTDQVEPGCAGLRRPGQRIASAREPAGPRPGPGRRASSTPRRRSIRGDVGGVDGGPGPAARPARRAVLDVDVALGAPRRAQLPFTYDQLGVVASAPSQWLGLRAAADFYAGLVAAKLGGVIPIDRRRDVLESKSLAPLHPDVPVPDSCAQRVRELK
jgi:hypothetical protein